MTDILIRGMEMPKEGEKILIAADGSVWVNAWPTRGYMRMENVHAVPLPEGHGRLIDADAFLATIRPLCTEDAQAACTLETVKQLMVKRISSAPTVVPKEGGAWYG